jgi:hypothetical protein
LADDGSLAAAVASSHPPERTEASVIREELQRCSHWEERHRRLIARIVIVIVLTVVVDAVASFLVWVFERNARATDIHGLGDAFFFSTVQLLTVSSQLRNPLTAAGRIVDIVLELWAVIVVASLGGSFASFFTSGDKRPAGTRETTPSGNESARPKSGDLSRFGR